LKVSHLKDRAIGIPITAPKYISVAKHFKQQIYVDNNGKYLILSTKTSLQSYVYVLFFFSSIRVCCESI